MRIIINTIASYSRTIIGIIFVLFSNRWVLDSLGVSDFGIYSLVGSILTIVVFLNTILANGNSRFLAISIGRKNEESVKELFKTIVVIHTIIPIVVIIVGYIVGIYAIENWLEIPDTRISATISVFQVSVISSLFAMIAVPYTALFIANQNIITYSLITLVQSFLYFISAYLLRYFQSEHLIIYACLMSASNIIIYSMIILIATKKYTYCNKFWFSKFNISKAKEIVRFAFWNFLGNLGHLCRTQGISIIVNLEFGTQGNAALGIANQVATQSANLTNALGSATSPEVYKRIGEGNFDSANRLCNSISKFGTFLILLLSTIIIANINDLLSLWLTKVPPYTSELCICFILMYIFEKIPMGYNTYLSGINKISLVQTLTLFCYLLAIVFPYIGFTQIWGIVGVGLSCVVSMILATLSIVYCYNKYSGVNSTRQYIHLSVISLILFVISVITLHINKIADILSSLATIIASSILMLVIVVASFYVFIFNKDEKQTINNILLKLCKKK